MSLLSIASLALNFGAVNRATFHQDGVTPESDTTHTVMLGWLAIDIACRHPELGLNVGLVAQLALVHDMVEAAPYEYGGGDTNSFSISAEDKAAKDAREKTAMAWLLSGPLADHPHLATLVAMYECNGCPEARFVRYMDKVTPKLTHALNGGAAFVKMGKSWRDVYVAHNVQIIALEQKYPEFADVVGAYLEAACDASEEAYFQRVSARI